MDFGGCGCGGDASTLTEGRSAATDPGKVHHVPELPKDAIMVKRPDGSTIYDADSATKRLMAPPRANFQEVYAAGERTANWPFADRLEQAKIALQQFGWFLSHWPYPACSEWPKSSLANARGDVAEIAVRSCILGSTESACRRILAKSPSFRLRSNKPGLSIQFYL